MAFRFVKVGRMQGYKQSYYKFFLNRRPRKNGKRILVDFHTHTAYSDTLSAPTGFRLLTGLAKWLAIAESHIHPLKRFRIQRKFYDKVALTDHSYSADRGGIHASIYVAGQLIKRKQYDELQNILFGEEIFAESKGSTDIGIDFLVFHWADVNKDNYKKEFRRLKKEYGSIISHAKDLIPFARHLKKLYDRGEIPLYAPAHILEGHAGYMDAGTIMQLVREKLIPVIEVHNGGLLRFQNEFLRIFARRYNLQVIAGSDVHSRRRFIRKIGYLALPGAAKDQKKMFDIIKKGDVVVKGRSEFYLSINESFDLLFVTFFGYLVQWVHLFENALKYESIPNFVFAFIEQIFKLVPAALAVILGPLVLLSQYRIKKIGSIRLINDLVKLDKKLLRELKSSKALTLQYIYLRNKWRLEKS